MKYILKKPFLTYPVGHVFEHINQLIGYETGEPLASILPALMLSIGIIEEYSETKKTIWSPKTDERYWFIGSDNVPDSEYWLNDDIDRGRRDFLGIYKHKADAIAARDRIKTLLKEKK